MEFMILAANDEHEIEMSSQQSRGLNKTFKKNVSYANLNKDSKAMSTET